MVASVVRRWCVERRTRGELQGDRSPEIEMKDCFPLHHGSRFYIFVANFFPKK